MLLCATVINSYGQLHSLGIAGNNNKKANFRNFTNEKQPISTIVLSDKYHAHLSDDSINKELINTKPNSNNSNIKDKFIVYPNQAEGYLVISYYFGDIQNLSIQVVDVIGNTEIINKTDNINSGGNVIYIDLINSIGNRLANGFYMVIISSSNLHIASFPITVNR